MKNEVLKVLLLTLTSVSLVAGMVNSAQASGEQVDAQVKQEVAAQDNLRGFNDHPVHLTYPTVGQDPDFNTPPLNGIILETGRPFYVYSFFFDCLVYR